METLIILMILTNAAVLIINVITLKNMTCKLSSLNQKLEVQRIYHQSRNRILQVTGDGKSGYFRQLAVADLVYKNNHNGTYHILKNRYGKHGQVTAEEMIKILHDIAIREDTLLHTSVKREEYGLKS